MLLEEKNGNNSKIKNIFLFIYTSIHMYRKNIFNLKTINYTVIRNWYFDNYSFSFEPIHIEEYLITFCSVKIHRNLHVHLLFFVNRKLMYSKMSFYVNNRLYSEQEPFNSTVKTTFFSFFFTCLNRKIEVSSSFLISPHRWNNYCHPLYFSGQYSNWKNRLIDLIQPFLVLEIKK